MAIRVYKPTTAGRRNASVSDFSELTRSTPEKSLVRKLSKTGGRNSYGRMTSRHRGGGHKRQYRLIDFKRWDKDGVPAKVAHIEYDPNRSARIALLHYADGEKRYIIAPEGVKQGDIIETGTQINCEPSGQIVGNIFFNKAPLHDGAMIIRDGMIHAAGCILPLTKNTSVSAELGTRHRAALGVSEESDAVVVVVSEETGQISVAVNGVLARRFTRDTLRDVLEGYLIPQEEASTVRRKFDVLKSKRTVKK